MKSTEVPDLFLETDVTMNVKKETKQATRPTLRASGERSSETHFQLKSNPTPVGPLPKSASIKEENTLLFPGMDEDSMSDAMTRDENGEPMMKNIQVFAIQKQELGKQLASSVLSQVYKICTSMGGFLQMDSPSMCCNIDPNYIKKFQSLSGGGK
jgi:hypothetical protein